MCYQDNRTERGDRLQHELFMFVTEDMPEFNFDMALPEMQELMTYRKEVLELMAMQGKRLVETFKHSAADMVGMDLICFDLPDGSYHVIDVTLDAKCKEGLPFLRTESVFVIDVNEDDRLDMDSKRRFLDVLLDLMTLPSVFSVTETPPPNYTAKLSFLELADQIENFRRQLDVKVASLQREQLLDEDASPVLGREAAQLHEYSVHLARAMAFAKAEHVRQSDLEYKAKVEHFASCMRAATFESVRAYLGLDCGKSRSGTSYSTHTASYAKKIDCITMSVEDYATPFVLYRMSTLVAEVVKLVCERTRGAALPQSFWVAKHELEHMPARVKVIGDAITIIHSTKIHSLLGVPEKLQKTKTALRKERRKEQNKAQVIQMATKAA